MGIPSRAKRYDVERVRNSAQRELDEEGEEKEPVKSVYIPKLEPFVFTPGPVPQQSELQKDAEKKVWKDKSCSQVVKDAKRIITEALQGALDEANEQLARGEAITSTAQFPLLTPVHFKDLDMLAEHDFNIDVHTDIIDGALKQVVAEVLKIMWQHVSVENVDKAKMLERYNEALLCRMETLEHHLSDRSRQLSSCRFAYFLEITHLRNQVYRKMLEGEDFEPVEAYFFDPTEYLEEDLRLMLNEKIKMSCRTYHRRLIDMKRHCEDLELQLETALQSFDPRKSNSLNEMLQITCTKHGRKSTVHALQQFAEKEMLDWAEQLILKRERLMADTAKEELEALQQELRNKAFETQQTRVCLVRAMEELKEEQRRLEEVEAQMMQLKSDKRQMEDRLYGRRSEVEPIVAEADQLLSTSKADTDIVKSVHSEASEEEVLRLKAQLAKVQQRLQAEQDKREQAETQARMMSDRQEALQRALAEHVERRSRVPNKIAVTGPPPGQQRTNPALGEDSCALSAAGTRSQSVAGGLSEFRKDGKGARGSSRARDRDSHAQRSASSLRSPSRARSVGRGGKKTGKAGGGAATGDGAQAEAHRGEQSEDRAAEDENLKTQERRGSEELLPEGEAAQSDDDKHAEDEHDKDSQVNEDEGEGAEEDTAGEGQREVKSNSRGRSPASSLYSTRASWRHSVLQGLDVSLEAFKQVQQEHMRQLQQQDGHPSEMEAGELLRSSVLLPNSRPLTPPLPNSRPLTPPLPNSRPLSPPTRRSRRDLGSGTGEALRRLSDGKTGRRASQGKEDSEALASHAGTVADDDGVSEDDELGEEQEAQLQSRMEEVRKMAEWFRQHLRPDGRVSGAIREGEAVSVPLPVTLMERQVQTAIAMDPSKTGFYMHELPDTEMEIAIRQELEDLKICAETSWQGALSSIRSAYNPPVGIGPGCCKRAAFLRLFMSCRERIQRHTELANLCEKMRRAELHHILDGIRFLMESALPDTDVELREAVFGRGFTDANLQTKGEEFASVVRKWRRQLATVINVLSEHSDDVQLGVHLGRRVFVSGSGGTAVPMLGGAAGGGMAARQVRTADSAGATKPCYPGLVLEDDDDETPRWTEQDRNGSKQSDEPEAEADKLQLQGKPALHALDTLAPVEHVTIQGGPYLVPPAVEMSPRGPEGSAPFVLERGGMAARPLSLDLFSGDGEDSGYLAELLGTTPEDLQIVARRVPSKPRRSLAVTSTPAKDSCSSTAVAAPTRTASAVQEPAKRGCSFAQRFPAGEPKHARPSMTPSQVQLSTESHSLPVLSSVSLTSTLEEPAAEVQNQDGVSEGIVAQKQRLAPCWSAPGGKLTAISGVATTAALGPDMEEPQAEPAPSRPQSGKCRINASSGGLDRDREIERLRHTLCSGGLPRGPLPSAEYQRSQATRPGRPAGGRHTKQERWLLEKVSPGARIASAGRVRPLDPRGEAGPKPGSAPAGLFGTRPGAGRRPHE